LRACAFTFFLLCIRHATSAIPPSRTAPPMPPTTPPMMRLLLALRPAELLESEEEARPGVEV